MNNQSRQPAMASGTSNASDVLKSLLNNAHSNTLLRTRSDVIRDKPVTLSDGKRIMLRAKSKETKQREAEAISGMSADKSTIECIDMASLWEKIRIEEATKRELLEFEKKKEALEESGQELRELTAAVGVGRKKKGKVNTLWTEKYRPKKFIDLIGNERVNASILKWLSEWTYAVKGGKLIDSNSYDRDMYKDPLKRPRKKILLIHGPPGIGKTTIAQCVCKQLGYQIQEVNSSDERSGVVVKEKVKNALRMRSLSGKNVCLLLDEIDGAVGNEGGFIKILIGLLNRDIRATEEWNSFNKLRWNKREDFLKRPIIALCNDIGAHCLDQLKPFCEVVQFKKSSKKSIKKRLKLILESERAGEMNESLLDDLIVSLDGDIRNCINFLQFNSRDLNGRLKDTEVVWFQLLKDIFNLENKNVRNDKSKSEVFWELQGKLANSANDLARINAGCFNLMLQVNEEYGSNLAKLDEVSDWLYFEDVMGQHYRQFEREELAQYGAVAPLKFFTLFANFSDGSFYDRRERFNFKSQERYDTRRTVNEVVARLVRAYRFDVSRERLVADELALLNAIVVPTGLPVKELEHDESRLATIAGVLEQLGIAIEGGGASRKFRNGGGISNRNHHNSPNGYMAARRFNPDIVAGLVDCVDKSGGERLGADKERVRRDSGSGHGVARRPAADADGEGADGDDARESLNAVRAMPYLRAVEQHLARTATAAAAETGNSVDRTKRVRDPTGGDADPDDDDGGARKTARTAAVSTVDYFRSRYASFQAHATTTTAASQTQTQTTGSSSEGVMHLNENRIWIKYHEGFSNAVRKEITLRGLLA